MKNCDNPFNLFEKHFNEAKNNSYINQANAMNIATVDENNKPSSRMVLLKEFDEKGFVFYTNLNSRKSENIKNNPFVSICFHWEPIGIQVRIEGKATQVPDSQADEYYNSRHKGSRIGAWASDQSQELDSEQTLLDKIKYYEDKFKGDDIPRPQFWSGYLVSPEKIEFWYDGEFRIHTRKKFEVVNGKWEMVFLYP